jgi:hypothetical protein
MQIGSPVDRSVCSTEIWQGKKVSSTAVGFTPHPDKVATIKLVGSWIWPLTYICVVSILKIRADLLSSNHTTSWHNAELMQVNFTLAVLQYGTVATVLIPYFCEELLKGHTSDMCHWKGINILTESSVATACQAVYRIKI